MPAAPPWIRACLCGQRSCTTLTLPPALERLLLPLRQPLTCLAFSAPSDALSRCFFASSAFARRAFQPQPLHLLLAAFRLPSKTLPLCQLPACFSLPSFCLVLGLLLSFLRGNGELIFLLGLFLFAASLALARATAFLASSSFFAAAAPAPALTLLRILPRLLLPELSLISLLFAFAAVLLAVFSDSSASLFLDCSIFSSLLDTHLSFS